MFVQIGSNKINSDSGMMEARVGDSRSRSPHGRCLPRPPGRPSSAAGTPHTPASPPPPSLPSPPPPTTHRTCHHTRNGGNGNVRCYPDLPSLLVYPVDYCVFLPPSTDLLGGRIFLLVLKNFVFGINFFVPIFISFFVCIHCLIIGSL